MDGGAASGGCCACHLSPCVQERTFATRLAVEHKSESLCSLNVPQKVVAQPPVLQRGAERKGAAEGCGSTVGGQGQQRCSWNGTCPLPSCPPISAHNVHSVRSRMQRAQRRSAHLVRAPNQARDVCQDEGLVGGRGRGQHAQLGGERGERIIAHLKGVGSREIRRRLGQDLVHRLGQSRARNRGASTARRGAAGGAACAPGAWPPSAPAAACFCLRRARGRGATARRKW